MYFKRERKPFLLDHCWNVVQHAHKWQPFEGYQSSPSVNTSPIDASTLLDEDSPMETIPETQEFMQTSNSCRRPIGTKKANELKRKGVAEASVEEDRELNEVMKSYKDEILKSKELKIMLKDTSTILTPAIRMWFERKQVNIKA